MGRLRLASELTGQGRPLVLIPGTFSTRRVWLRQLGTLTPTFGCLLFDQPGTGDSPDAGGGFTPDDLADAVVELMDEADFARADLVGHSLGASVALLVAARHPDRVRSVVAAAPVLFQDAFLLATLDHWDALARSNLSDHDLNLAVALGAFGRDAFERLVPAVLADLDAHPLSRSAIAAFVECDRLLDLRGLLTRVDAHVLVVAGGDDHLAGVAQARAVAEATPGARLETIPGAGHSVQLEAAAAFNRLVTAFLSG